MIGDEADLLQFLPSIALFGGLTEPTLLRVIAKMRRHSLDPGAQVCCEGEVGRSMFVVRQGEAVVYRDLPSGKRVKMVRMGEGEFFGEMTLIDIQKRSASVMVDQPTLLLSLGNKDLYALYQEDTPGYVMVLQNLCRELSRRLRTTNQKLTSMADDASDDKTLIRKAVKRKP